MVQDYFVGLFIAWRVPVRRSIINAFGNFMHLKTDACFELSDKGVSTTALKASDEHVERFFNCVPVDKISPRVSDEVF